jgi:hypothetical protein
VEAGAVAASSAPPHTIPVTTACLRVPPPCNAFVTPEFVQRALDAMAAGAPRTLDVTEDGGVMYVEEAQWALWVAALPPMRVRVESFAHRHGLPSDTVRALVAAGALHALDSPWLGTLVALGQPLVNPALLRRLDVACAATGRGDVTPARVQGGVPAVQVFELREPDSEPEVWRRRVRALCRVPPTPAPDT